MPSWHPPDSDSGSVQDDESIIKVHNDAKIRFSWIWPFGIWTISPVPRRGRGNAVQTLLIERYYTHFTIVLGLIVVCVAP